VFQTLIRNESLESPWQALVTWASQAVSRKLKPAVPLTLPLPLYCAFPPEMTSH
jgi:hypothetical protein